MTSKGNPALEGISSWVLSIYAVGGQQRGLYAFAGTYICAVLHCINIPRKRFHSGDQVSALCRDLAIRRMDCAKALSLYCYRKRHAKLSTSAEGECDTPGAPCAYIS